MPIVAVQFQTANENRYHFYRSSRMMYSGVGVRVSANISLLEIRALLPDSEGLERPVGKDESITC
jgi:hypothetical protein